MKQLGVCLLLLLVVGSSDSQVMRRRVLNSGVVMSTERDSVNAENRNAYSAPGYTGVTGVTDLHTGAGAASSARQSGWEFKMSIANGKTIDTCYFMPAVDYVSGWVSTDTLQIEMYNVDNAAVYVEGAGTDIRGHAALVGSTILFPQAFASGSGTRYTSPNIASLLQTVVNRAGYSSGNYVGVVLSGKTTVANHYIEFQGWDTYNITGGQGVLYIRYH